MHHLPDGDPQGNPQDGNGHGRHEGGHTFGGERAPHSLIAEIPPELLPLQCKDIHGRTLREAAEPLSEQPNLDAPNVQKTERTWHKKVVGEQVIERTGPIDAVFAWHQNKHYREAMDAYVRSIRKHRADQEATDSWNNTLEKVVNASTGQSTAEGLARLKSAVSAATSFFGSGRAVRSRRVRPITNGDQRRALDRMYESLQGKEESLVDKSLNGEYPITETFTSLAVAMGSARAGWRRRMDETTEVTPATVTSDCIEEGLVEAHSWIDRKLDEEVKAHVDYIKERPQIQPGVEIPIIDGDRHLGYFGNRFALRLVLGDRIFTELIEENIGGYQVEDPNQIAFVADMLAMSFAGRYGIGVRQTERLKKYFVDQLEIGTELEGSPYATAHALDFDEEYFHELDVAFGAYDQLVYDVSSRINDPAAIVQMLTTEAASDQVTTDIAEIILIEAYNRARLESGSAPEDIAEYIAVYESIVQGSDNGQFQAGGEKELGLRVRDVLGDKARHYIAHGMLCPAAFKNGLNMHGENYKFLKSAQDFNYGAEQNVVRARKPGQIEPLVWRVVPESAQNVLKLVGDITEAEVHAEQEAVTPEMAARFDTMLKAERGYWSKVVNLDPGLYAMVANDAAASARRYLTQDRNYQNGNVSPITRTRVHHAWEMALEQAFVLRRLGDRTVTGNTRDDLYLEADNENGARTSAAIAQTLAADAHGPMAESLMEVLLEKVKGSTVRSPKERGGKLLRSEIIGMMIQLNGHGREMTPRMAELTKEMIDTVWEGAFDDVATLAKDYDAEGSNSAQMFNHMIYLLQTAPDASALPQGVDPELSRQVQGIEVLRKMFSDLFPFTEAHRAMQQRAAERKSRVEVPIKVKGRTGADVARAAHEEKMRDLAKSIIDAENDVLAEGVRDHAKMWQTFIRVLNQMNSKLRLGAKIQTDLTGRIIDIDVAPAEPTYLPREQRQLAPRTR